MLRELTLTNFKSFAGDPQTIPFAPVTIFVGANGSGKSNALDAIRFLQGFATGITVSEIMGGKWEGGREVFPGIRGGAAEVSWRQCGLFSLKSVIDMEIGEGSTSRVAEHEVHIAVDPEVIIDAETLSLRDAQHPEQVLHASRFDEPVPSIRLRDGRHLELRDSDFLRTTLLLTRSLSPDVHSRSIDGRTQSVFLAHRFLQTWSDVEFLDIRPSRMRDFSDVRSTQLGSSGENISAVLYELCQDANSEARLLEWISSVCAPPVSKFFFERTKLGHVLAHLIEDNGEGGLVSFRNVSDGTLRFIGLLAAIFSVPEGSILLIEEVENGLHPTRVHLLVELFEQLAEARNLQIIATTHSSQVLLGLSEDALRNVVLFVRNEEHRGTIVRRLGELPNFDDVTQKTTIDELFTTGWLEFAV